MGNELSTNSITGENQTNDQEGDYIDDYGNDSRFSMIRKTIEDLSAKKNELSERVLELEQENEGLATKQKEFESVEFTRDIDIINLHNKYGTKIKNLCDSVIENQKKNASLQSELNLSKSVIQSLNNEVTQLKQMILDSNNNIQNQSELLNERTGLLALIAISKAKTEELERNNQTKKKEIDNLNGLLLRQRSNITELQNSSKSKNEKLKVLSAENKELNELVSSLADQEDSDCEDCRENERLNGLVERQRKNITELQNSSKLKNEKIKQLKEKNGSLKREKAELVMENEQLNEIVKDIETQSTPQTQAVLECNICLDECVENCWIFAPCGHYACGNCAHQLTNCQTCRVRITSKIKLFL